jgi:hypothetical protein
VRRELNVSNTAYVLIGIGAKFLPEIMVAALQARAVDPVRDIILLFSGDVHPDLSELAQQHRINLTLVPQQYRDKMSAKYDVQHYCAKWRGCWMKFMLWSFTQYDMVSRLRLCRGIIVCGGFSPGPIPLFAQTIVLLPSAAHAT